MEVYADGLKWIGIKSIKDALSLMDTAHRTRNCTFPVTCNGTARSTLLYSIEIEAENIVNNTKYVGKLNFVDLAGSERVKKSAATGSRLKEAQNINKSLSALRDVLQALSNNDRFIPFRNSTLTDVLTSSLFKGDNKNQIMVYLNICPTEMHSFETISTLKFGQRVITKSTERNRVRKKGKK